MPIRNNINTVCQFTKKYIYTLTVVLNFIMTISFFHHRHLAQVARVKIVEPAFQITKRIDIIVFASRAIRVITARQVNKT